MAQKFYLKLENLLKKDARFVDKDGELLKTSVIDSAYKADKNLVELLLSDKELKQKFFNKVKDVMVFNINDFVNYIQDKNFLANSYTKYKNKIGLNIDGKFLNERDEVSLVWPFKDCILEGGMTKEDEKRKEIFFNEILAKDEIDKLFSPKILTNWKRYTKKGEEKVKEFERGKDGVIRENLIIKGNNLLALHSLKQEFQGKIKLIYIDPPYNTENSKLGYNDNFNHSTWLTFMKNRLEVARDLLTDNGSIYVNIDYNEVHYLKIIMDDIFGRDNFQREIIWRIGWLSGYKTGVDNYIRNHDTILFYTNNPKDFIFNKTYNTREDYVERFNDGDKKEILEYLKKNKITEEEGKRIIKFMSGVGLPERYPLEDTWNASSYDKLNSIAIVSFSGEKVSKLLGSDEFKGQKSEKLLKRIIEISTNKGDIVLDFCAGTGTTGAVAHKLGRQWILCEQLDYTKNVTAKRIQEVLKGEQIGISKSVNWKGGGDFIYCELMKYNELFIERIKEAKGPKELLKIWEEIKEKGFINYNVDIQKFDETIVEFKKLSLDKQKHTLFGILNKNQLYINLSEIDDKDFKVDKEDKELNNKFYDDTENN